jgi:hypothetical protein
MKWARFSVISHAFPSGGPPQSGVPDRAPERTPLRPPPRGAPLGAVKQTRVPGGGLLVVFRRKCNFRLDPLKKIRSGGPPAPHNPPARPRWCAPPPATYGARERGPTGSRAAGVAARCGGANPVATPQKASRMNNFRRFSV